MIELSLEPAEQGTIFINIKFFDETPANIAPNTMFWTLTDTLGNVVNSKQDIEIVGPTADEDIVLSGLDLQIGTGLHGTERIITFYGTYDSTKGSDLPYKEQAIFDIEAFVAVANT